jgi:hypothetical protein
MAVGRGWLLLAFLLAALSAMPRTGSGEGHFRLDTEGGLIVDLTPKQPQLPFAKPKPLQQRKPPPPPAVAAAPTSTDQRRAPESRRHSGEIDGSRGAPPSRRGSETRRHSIISRPAAGGPCSRAEARGSAS